MAMKSVPLSRIRTPNVMRLAEIFTAPTPEIEDEGIEAPLNVETNEENRDLAIRNWQLGPEKASIDPAANSAYWQQMAVTWNVDEAQARRRLCANCEYFCNTPEDLEMMEVVPLDRFDMDGGGRGYCKKLHFICHSLRVCQAWEEKETGKDDD